ncbi:unnamed protein product [Cuscuta epithymum]|uniref:Uncharacterized protein n=1 Tax=Cuscuta epithymum TaxID=186058 RepID=A0AAV0G0S2_9ASTE|nr:unnamed protein product [Cuscuta epithymum]
MLMDNVSLNNYLGACTPIFAKCGLNTCYVTSAALNNILHYVCLWMYYV